MRICVISTSWWDDLAQFDERISPLRNLFAQGDEWFHPVHRIIGCGTWSSPAYATDYFTVVNAGIIPGQSYDTVWRNYSGCATTSLCAWLANRRDWDVAVCLDVDTVYGAIDWDALLREFLSRPQELLADNWWGHVGTAVAWKPAAVVRYLHQRLRPNIMENIEGAPEPMLLENEFSAIFNGRIWNPWPHLITTRQDYGLDSEKYVGKREPIEQNWPFCRLPNPEVREWFAEQVKLAKPVRSE